jgi:hypothetical protein
MGRMNSAPNTVITSATAQKIRKVLAIVRAAFSGFASPSARETTDAPPAPTVVATPPRAVNTGAMIDAPAAASELKPTYRK